MTMLPERAREELRKAAMTSTAVDPLARVKAIEKVMKKLRIRHPECFKVDDDEVEHRRPAAVCPTGQQSCADAGVKDLSERLGIT